MFEDLDPATITEDEINNRVYSLMARLIKENLQNPTYEEGKDVVVHYGLLDEKEKIYGISEAAFIQSLYPPYYPYPRFYTVSCKLRPTEGYFAKTSGRKTCQKYQETTLCTEYSD